MAKSGETTRELDVSDESGFVSAATDASTPTRNVDARPAEPHIGRRVGAQASEVEDLDIDKDLDSLKTPAEDDSGGALGKLQRELDKFKQDTLQRFEAIDVDRCEIQELKEAMRQVPQQVCSYLMATYQDGNLALDMVKSSVETALGPLTQRMDQLCQDCAEASQQFNIDVNELRGECRDLNEAVRVTNTNVKANRLSMNNTNRQTQAKLSLHDEQLCRAQRQSGQALTLSARAAGQAITATQGVGELRDQLSANAEYVVRVEAELQETQTLLRTTSITASNLLNDYNQAGTHGGLQQARDEDPPDQAEVAPSIPQAAAIVIEPAAPARSADADTGDQDAAADGGAEDGVNPDVS